MARFARILFLFTVVTALSMLRGGVITLSYTQYFDYNLQGVVGHPSATWTATFDTALEPGGPFPSAPSTFNQDFVQSGLSVSAAPHLIWISGGIEGATPAGFGLGGLTYFAFPFLPLFPTPPCSLPCSATAIHPDQAASSLNPAVSFFSSTPDHYAAVAAVPEPSPGLVVALGLGGIGMVYRRFSRAEKE